MGSNLTLRGGSKRFYRNHPTNPNRLWGGLLVVQLREELARRYYTIRFSRGADVPSRLTMGRDTRCACSRFPENGMPSNTPQHGGCKATTWYDAPVAFLPNPYKNNALSNRHSTWTPHTSQPPERVKRVRRSRIQSLSRSFGLSLSSLRPALVLRWPILRSCRP